MDRFLEEFKTTTDSSVFTKVYRRYLEGHGDRGVSCCRCPPHKGCNTGNGGYWDYNWKRYRKFQARYLKAKETIRDLFVIDDIEEEMVD